jgi:hypothetical protein
LIGGHGADTLAGGPDLDVFSCGPGADVVSAPQPRELLGADCETTSFAYGPIGEGGGPSQSITIGARPERISSRALTFSARCPIDSERDFSPVPPDGTLIVKRATADNRRLAAGRIVGPRGRCRRPLLITARLTRAGRRLLARARRRVLATIAIHGVNLPSAAWRIRLHA